jgi:hypothetical protein
MELKQKKPLVAHIDHSSLGAVRRLKGKEILESFHTLKNLFLIKLFH